VADRGAEASQALVDYVVRRIERSFEAAQVAAEELDRAALERKQRITRKLAAQVLGEPQGGSGVADER
jgi:chromosomal replication initiation ATPase DnaA